MKKIKQLLIMMIIVVLSLNTMTGCTKAPTKEMSAPSESKEIVETTPESETEADKETEKEEEKSENIISAVVYNPTSNFTFTASTEGYDEVTDSINIANGEITNGNPSRKILDRIFFIGTTYSMELSKDFKAGDILVFKGEKPQAKDTKYSIKDSKVTVTVSAENAEKVSLSVLKRYATVIAANGEFTYEVISIQDSGKAYVLNIDAKLPEDTEITTQYIESNRQYIITSSNPIHEVHATFEGFAENQGVGAVTSETGVKFAITINEDNTITIEKLA